MGFMAGHRRAGDIRPTKGQGLAGAWGSDTDSDSVKSMEHVRSESNTFQSPRQALY